MSGLSIKLLISIFLAAPPSVAQLSPVAANTPSPGPGFADCPNGIICPILPRQEEDPVTVIDPDCEDEPVTTPIPLAQSANLPVQIRPPVLPTTMVTVTECPDDCDEDPSTVTICPPEGCTTEAQPPVATRLAICPPEECPECTPDACTPCPPEEPECEVPEDAPPACPDYCPPAGEEATSDQLAPVPTPTPTPSPSSSALVNSPTVTLPDAPEETTAPTGPPVAGAERMQVAPGVYVAVAAVFVALNLF